MRNQVRLSILAIGAHMDEAVVGCGGTLARYVKDGHDVTVLSFVGDNSPVPITGTPERNRLFVKEAKEATKKLGVREHLIFEYRVGNVPNNFESRKKAAEVIDKVRPDIALLVTPYAHPPVDLWPDHEGAYHSSMEALIWPHNFLLRQSQSVNDIFEYEILANRTFDPDVFVDITDTIDLVVDALQAFVPLRGQKSIDEIVRLKRVNAEFRGLQCHTRHTAEGKYIEAFQSRQRARAPYGRTVRYLPLMGKTGATLIGTSPSDKLKK